MKGNKRKISFWRWLFNKIVSTLYDFPQFLKELKVMLHSKMLAYAQFILALCCGVCALSWGFVGIFLSQFPLRGILLVLFGLFLILVSLHGLYRFEVTTE